MPSDTIEQQAAVTQMHPGLTSTTSFDGIVAVPKQALTVSKLRGFEGCRPCLSGLDRPIIEDIAMRGIR